MLHQKQLAFIGGGAMAEALLKGLLTAKLVEPQQIMVCDVAQSRLDYLRHTYNVLTTVNGCDAAGQADIVFLTVKPQVIDDVLVTIAPVMTPAKVVISVAAGITIDRIEAKLGKAPIIRVMPNTPVAVGAGVSAFALGQNARPEHGELATLIFDAVGKAVAVDEKAMDAVTGLSGSGPAYTFLFIEALADAGVRVGLSRQTALLLAAQTILGAAKMVVETGEHPAKLRDAVISPAGTTIAGLHVLEQKGVRGTVIDAVVAATERSREMGQLHGK